MMAMRQQVAAQITSIENAMPPAQIQAITGHEFNRAGYFHGIPTGWNHHGWTRRRRFWFLQWRHFYSSARWYSSGCGYTGCVSRRRLWSRWRADGNGQLPTAQRSDWDYPIPAEDGRLLISEDHSIQVLPDLLQHLKFLMQCLSFLILGCH